MKPSGSFTVQDVLGFGYEMFGESVNDLRGILHSAILHLLCEGQIRRHTLLGKNSASLIYSALTTRESSGEDVVLAIAGKEDFEPIQTIKRVLDRLKLQNDVDLTPPFTDEVLEVDIPPVTFRGTAAISIPFSKLPAGKRLIFQKTLLDYGFNLVDETECTTQPSNSENLHAARALCHRGIDQILLCEEDGGFVPYGDFHMENCERILGYDESYNDSWVEISRLMSNWVDYSHRPQDV